MSFWHGSRGAGMGDISITTTRLAGEQHADDVLVVGPSLGTAVDVLWGACAEQLGERFEVVGWDLPGHGQSPPTATHFSVADLATAVRHLIVESGPRRRVWYA